MSVSILLGDVRARLAELPDESVHCVVTSPPYFGLRDYGVAGQIGLEDTPAAFVAVMVDVFRDVRRVLRSDGTLWLNLGDSYAGGGTIGRNDTTPEALARRAEKYGTGVGSGSLVGASGQRARVADLKPKDLIGIPWRVAFALQADGWYLRQDIIWSKPNPMPESVTDRCCKSHEYIFLFSKSARYYFDNDAIKEDAAGYEDLQQVPAGFASGDVPQKQPAERRAKRNVPGLQGGDTQGVGPQIQSNGQGQRHSETLLLFGEGTGSESDLPPVIRANGGTARPLPFGNADARERAALQGSKAQIRFERQGEGDEGREGQAACENREGPVLQAQGRDQAQASDPINGLHADPSAMAGDQDRVQPRMCLLPEADGAIGDGPCDPAIEGRASHGAERSPGVQDVQREQGRPQRTKRSVWHVATQAFSAAHFATFPPALIEPCILAGCPKDCCAKCGAPVVRDVAIGSRPNVVGDGQKHDGTYYRHNPGGGVGNDRRERIDNGWTPSCPCDAGTVRGVTLDPFGGAGTTGLVADRHGRNAVLIELNPEYAAIAERRIQGDSALFAQVSVASHPVKAPLCGDANIQAEAP